MTSGIIRKVDELGRIVIPKEIRNILHLKEDTPLEISLSGRRIVLDVYSPIPEFKQLSETFVRLMARDLHLPAAICSLQAPAARSAIIPASPCKRNSTLSPVNST